MAGTLTVGGNTIVTHTGVEGAGTVSANNVSLGSNVQFPAGHVISHSIPFVKSGSTSIETSNTSFAESGIEVSITPKLSSANSRIVVQFFTGYPRTSGGAGTLLQYTCGRATSTSTTYSSANDISQSNYFYPNSTGIYWSQHATFIDSGNYTAGTQYFYQIYFLSSGGVNVQLVRDGGTATMLAYEVKII